VRNRDLTMPASDLLPRLAEHRTIGGAPPAELAWLAAHGRLQQFESGDVLAPKEQPITTLWLSLSGVVAIHVDRGLGPRKVAEWRSGDVLGLLPYSRMTNPPGSLVIIEPAELVAIDREHLPELIRECPVVTATLVHVMLDRARVFTSNDLHDEKMMSLGRISAGLAHELNNPASAAARSAGLLAAMQVQAEDTARSLAAAGLTNDQLAAVDRARASCSRGSAPVLTPMQRADREEALVSWLEEHDADPDAADALIDSPATIEVLDQLAAAVRGDVLDTVVRWIAACCSIRALAAEVERSASRVHDLVGAVKRFTYMDRQQSPEAIDLMQGLRDSVALMAHKARHKSVGIDVRADDALPSVRAIGSDLNQVWTNLLDNAIDAAPSSGQVTITATREPGFVVVHVVDDGPGIPDDIQERIFDPFFTTKPVGQGTGLGLEIARRLVRRNGGDITLESRPGRTEFRIAVPEVAGDGTEGPSGPDGDRESSAN